VRIPDGRERGAPQRAFSYARLLGGLRRPSGAIPSGLVTRRNGRVVVPWKSGSGGAVAASAPLQHAMPAQQPPVQGAAAEISDVELVSDDVRMVCSGAG
jgi:hypothetical protein